MHLFLLAISFLLAVPVKAEKLELVKGVGYVPSRTVSACLEGTDVESSDDLTDWAWEDFLACINYH